ncbi:MAG TPA: CopG family transcriptional regulator [Geobacteraceae bacterium]|nr:CopG family transcriptional regulator [Geobacteraceae bacterium]
MKTLVKRATIYLDEELHMALRMKTVVTSKTISELVNEAVRYSLAEDDTDLSAYRERINEPAVSYEQFVRELKKRGRI